MEIEWHQLELRYEALRASTPEQERRLLGSLASTGQQSTVVVVRDDKPNRYVLIDGYKRVRALRRLGRDTVRASLWDIGEMDALIVAHLMKRGEAPSPLEQGWLLRELQERFGLSLSELALRFDRSPSWVSRRLSLVKELPEEVHEQVRTGRIVAHAAMKYLVPLARANRADCLRLLEATQPRRVSTRQMERLYTAYMSGDDKARELALDQPWLFLEAEQQAKNPTVETTPAEQLLDDLRLLGVVCRRCLKRAQSGLLRSLLPFEAERVHRLWQAAQADFRALDQRCDGELTHVGSSS
jgi:ParB/RepB/Spo0J family partition protein